MSFQLIPTETIVQVIELINDQRDLAGLSRACCRFHELVEPFLYSKFEEDRFSGHGLVCLLRTIVNRPSLVRYIKIIALSELAPIQIKEDSFTYNPVQYGNWLGLRPNLVAYYTDCNALISSQGSEQKQPSVGDLVVSHLSRMSEKYSWEFLVVNLILLAPHLECLSITRFWNNNQEIISTLRIAADIQSSTEKSLINLTFKLPALHNISFWCYGHSDEQRLDIHNILPLLKMRSLRSLDCEGISREEIIENISFVSNLTSLTLKECGLPTNEIERIVEICNQLGSFQLGYSSHDEKTELNPSGVFHALLNSKDHLTSISIVDKEKVWLPDEEHFSTTIEPLPCLAEFSKLQNLELSYLILDMQILVSATDNNMAGLYGHFGLPTRSLSFHDLPASIVHLKVHFALPSIMSLFQAFDFEVLHNLKTICVIFDDRHEDPLDRKDWEDVSEQYRKHGIEVKFLWTHRLR